MSEQGQTTLRPYGKSDKKHLKSYCKTYRFNFSLSDPNEDSCPVFDYGIVVRSEEKKIIKKHREAKQNKANGSLELGNSEEVEDVRRLARKFEEKYGDKKGKNKSYSELGAGYDETDPFIDNTEVCNEELQEDLVTPHGGYYTNSGPLELKRVHASHSDEEVGKHKLRKILPVIEDNEEKTEEEESKSLNEDKQPTAEENFIVTKNVNDENEEQEANHQVSCNLEIGEEPVKKTKKRIISDDVINGDIKVKKAKTVKTLLEEKRFTVLSGEEPKKQPASVTSISEAIESVINAGINGENSNSSNTSNAASETSLVSEDSGDSKPQLQISPTPLPDNLSPEILSLVEQIKQVAQVTENTRKTFCPEINNYLKRLEWKSKDFSTTNRNLLFGHLACFLPCTKDTLMRRAKKLFIVAQENHIETLICKLKATIDATMPSLLEKYATDCQRIAEEKNLSTPYSNGNVEEENHQTRDSAAVKLPKRKFPWTEETRGYLRDIVKLKNKCYQVLKPRKSSNEDYVRAFLQSKIWILWPQGWMKTSILYRESSRSPGSARSNKHLSHSSKNNSLRLNNVSSSYPPDTSISKLDPLHVSIPVDTLQQRLKSPKDESTPSAAKCGMDPTNLLSKMTSLSETKVLPSPGFQRDTKVNKQELLASSLIKRTSESASCNDYNTTLSDLLKEDSLLLNGASLPLKNVNSSKKNSHEKELNLTSCQSIVNGTPSVIQSSVTSERTSMRASDSVSLSSITNCAYTSSLSRKEVSSNLPFNRKQRLLQLNNQSDWHAQTNCDTDVQKKTDYVELPYSAPFKSQTSVVEGKGRCMSDETTTATDILSQIISESLLAPSQPPSTTPITSLLNSKVGSDGKDHLSSKKNQELLFDDVMQDLKELNHMSSRGPLDIQHENKGNSYKSSWLYSSQHSPKQPTRSPHSPFQSEFMKHVNNSLHETPVASCPTSTSVYSNHSISPYENSAYVNEINSSVYCSTPRTNVQLQSISSHADNPLSKVSQMNQHPTKHHPNTGLSPGMPQGYMSQMDYNTDNQHLGFPQNFQYGLTNWPYSGSESQPHH